MRVPPVIQSGSTPFVILDCDYDLSETEGTQVSDPIKVGSSVEVGRRHCMFKKYNEHLQGDPPSPKGSAKSRLLYDFDFSLLNIVQNCHILIQLIFFSAK